ncbi:MAG: hypothetical protein FWE88_06240 [Phycisphaerae bacterium]|nr:hypothetical protein [Phycisphaerae bacterium]
MERLRTISHTDGRRGAALLEIVLALTLFFLSAAVIVGSLDQALRGSRVLRWEAQAADLAMSKMAQLQSELYSPVSEPETDYEKENEFLAGWSCEVVVDKMEMINSLVPPIDRVTVIIRKTPNFTYQLSQLMLENLPDEAEEDEDDTGGGGGGW